MYASLDPAGKHMLLVRAAHWSLQRKPTRMTALSQHFFDNENHANFPLPEGGRAVETVDEPEAVSDALLPNLEGPLR